MFIVQTNYGSSNIFLEDKRSLIFLLEVLEARELEFKVYHPNEGYVTNEEITELRFYMWKGKEYPFIPSYRGENESP